MTNPAARLQAKSKRAATIDLQSIMSVTYSASSGEPLRSYYKTKNQLRRQDRDDIKAR